MEKRKKAKVVCVRVLERPSGYTYVVHYDTRNKDGSLRRRQYHYDEKLPNNVIEFLKSAISYSVEIRGRKQKIFHEE